MLSQDRPQRLGQRNVVLFAVLDRSEARHAVHDTDLAADVDDREWTVELDVVNRQAEHLGLAHARTGPEIDQRGVSGIKSSRHRFDLRQGPGPAFFSSGFGRVTDWARVGFRPISPSSIAAMKTDDTTVMTWPFELAESFMPDTHA